MFRWKNGYWLKISVAIVFCFAIVFILGGCWWTQKTGSPVIVEKEFDTEVGAYVDTGVGLIISVPPASVAGKAELQVVYYPSSEQIGEGSLQLISIYDVNITPLSVEGEYQYPSVTLNFEIPKDVDPRSVAILEWTDEGWILAENEGGLPGGSVATDGNYISVVRKRLSKFSPATWAWIYKHIFYYLDKLPQLPPPDPQITVGVPEKTDGQIVVPVSVISPSPIPTNIPLIGGVGGMWYCIEVGEEWGVVNTEIKGANVLAPGDTRDLNITFRNTGGEASVCLRFKQFQVCPLGRAVVNWLTRLGVPVGTEILGLMNMDMELLLKTYERSAKDWVGFKDLVWLAKELLIKRLWKLAGPKAKFYANLIPVAVDITTYINALVDRSEPCQKITFYPGSPPRADFVFSPLNPKVNETVNFTDRSTDPDNDIVSWNWSFGDGTTSAMQNPSHSYKQAGTYTVRLMVMDSKGNNDSASKIINVTSSPPREPRVSVSPSSGTPGTKFYVQWEGFTPNSTLTSHLQKPDGTEFPTKKFSTDSQGQANHIIDSTGFSPGTYTLWAIDDATGIRTVNTATFIITKESPLAPKVTVSPSSGPAGTQFDVLWEGFTPNNTLTSHLKKPDGTEFPTKIFYTNSQGQATHTIDSTGFKPGTYELWGVDNATGTRTINTASFTILAPTTGTIQVTATLDGKPWEGPIAIKLIAPTGEVVYLSLLVPWEKSGLSPGTWALEFRSGGPEGGTLKDITPSSTQTLIAGGTITFTLNFVKGGPPDMPDLWVEDIRTIPESFSCGDTVKIGIMVRNEGMGDAVGVFRTCLYFDEYLIGYHDQNGLAGGRSLGAPYGAFFVWEQTLTWPNDGDYHTLKAVVDVNDVIKESNENNNMTSVQLKAACAETTIETTGTVQFVDIDGGFFGILGDDGNRYEPINLPSDCEVVGLRVWFKARILQRAIHMWGIPIEIIEIVPFPPDGFLSHSTGLLLPRKE
jgi:PKD repeat protein